MCHENAHQYYFSNRPKLLSVVLYVKQSLEKLFSICLPQTQEPEPNLHEPVTIDDTALESNLRAMARQAAERLTLAQQALDLQTQAIHAQYSQANEKNQWYENCRHNYWYKTHIHKCLKLVFEVSRIL